MHPFHRLFDDGPYPFAISKQFFGIIYDCDDKRI